MSFNPKANAVPATVAAAKAQVQAVQARIAAAGAMRTFGLSAATPPGAIAALIEGQIASRDAAMRRYGITSPSACKR